MVDSKALTRMIRDVQDFPKPGIVFKDITPLLADRLAFQSMIAELAKLVPPHTTTLAAIESRGFILGSALAAKLNLGLVLLRKPGKLPFATLTHSYDLEYGSDALEVHVDSLGPRDQVTIVDDVLATGGTAQAAETLCLETGAIIKGFLFLIELRNLKGRDKLKAQIQSLITF